MFTLKATPKLKSLNKEGIIDAFHNDRDFLNASMTPGTYANKSDILEYSKENTVKIWYGNNYDSYIIIENIRG